MTGSVAPDTPVLKTRRPLRGGASGVLIRALGQLGPGVVVVVASLAQLPFRESTFDGVLSWYSTIHSPDELVPQALGEIRRVLRLGGVALLGFQTGNEIRDVSDGYRRRGHEITLIRYSRTIGGWRSDCWRPGCGPLSPWNEPPLRANAMARDSSSPRRCSATDVMP